MLFRETFSRKFVRLSVDHLPIEVKNEKNVKNVDNVKNGEENAKNIRNRLF